MQFINKGKYHTINIVNTLILKSILKQNFIFQDFTEQWLFFFFLRKMSIQIDSSKLDTPYQHILDTPAVSSVTFPNSSCDKKTTN